MKNIFIILMLLLCCCPRVKAQPPRHPDTTRVGFEAGRAEAINAPILRGNGQGMALVPNRQQFCFDLEMDVELYFGGRITREVAVFINTTDGYLGYTTPSAGGPISDLIPEAESFRFTVMSFKLGNIYSYFNHKGNNGIEHLVSTSNTDAHETQINGLLGAAPLNRKSDYRTYCDGKARALAYKRNDGPTVWYVYGDRFPPTLTVQKFLGVFGVGVARTDAGTFMMMELLMGNNHTTIKHIERRRVCFDPTEFKMEEADFCVKSVVRLREEEQNINRAADQAARAECCVAERMNEVNFRREQLHMQQENLRRSQQGNLIQDSGAQRAFLGTMDPLISVRSAILSTQTNICATHFALSRGRSTDGGKMTCLRQLLSDLQQCESQMQAVDRRVTNIAQAIAEKSRLFYALSSRGGCN